MAKNNFGKHHDANSFIVASAMYDKWDLFYLFYFFAITSVFGSLGIHEITLGNI